MKNYLPLYSTKFSSSLTSFLTITCLICLLLISFILNSKAQAHEIRPAIVDFTFDKNGIYQLTIQQNLEALLSGIGSAHDDTKESENAKKYIELRNLKPSELEIAFEKFSLEFLQNMQLLFDKKPQNLKILDVAIPEMGDVDLARDSIINIAGIIPKDIKNMSWKWNKNYGNAVLRVGSESEPELFSTYLVDGNESEEVPVKIDCYNVEIAQKVGGCASLQNEKDSFTKYIIAGLTISALCFLFAGLWLRKKRRIKKY